MGKGAKTTTCHCFSFGVKLIVPLSSGSILRLRTQVQREREKKRDFSRSSYVLLLGVQNHTWNHHRQMRLPILGRDAVQTSPPNFNTALPRVFAPTMHRSVHSLLFDHSNSRGSRRHGPVIRGTHQQQWRTTTHST